MELLGWRDLAPGGTVVESGNSAQVETGSWRANRPVLDLDRCVHCMICWVFCPDGSFIVEEGKLTGIDYEHCKGCGICVVECPRKCIEMASEIPRPSSQGA